MVDTTGVARGVVWWLGWRPLLLTVLGSAVGVAAALAGGYIGPGTAASGLVLLVVGGLRPWVAKSGLALSGLVAVVFFVAGAGRVRSALGSAGVPTGWTDTVPEFVVAIATTAGLMGTPPADASVFVGDSVASLAVASLAGAVVGVGIWAVGRYRVNSGYMEARDGFVESVRERGKALLDDEGLLYTFTHGRGRRRFLDSPEEYHTTNMLVGETSIDLHHGSVYDVINREGSVSGNTKSLYYDQVASVDYDDPYLRIRMSDGDEVRIVASEEPEEVLERIQERLRRYKASPGDEAAGERGSGRDRGRGGRGRAPGGADGTDATAERGRERGTPDVGIGADADANGDTGVDAEGDEGETGVGVGVDTDTGAGAGTDTDTDTGGDADEGQEGPEEGGMFTSDFGDEIVDEVEGILDDFEGSDAVEAAGEALSGDAEGDTEGGSEKEPDPEGSDDDDGRGEGSGG